ncbi:MAG: R2-like ligand-binding oxidase [Acidimicrobiales bacterium]
MAQIETALDEVARRADEWGSLKPVRTDSVPWTLWEKAKQFFWDPATIDFSEDKAQWAAMPEDAQLAVSGLARGFMVGEEGVTLDIVPLLMAVADEGRLEEAIYLTSFTFEEAKHVDFFRRWFTAVDVDIFAMERLNDQRMHENGLEPPDRQRTNGMFERELPRSMRRLLTDRSPEAFLDASVTYNQFVEGCLANAGYKVWGELFESLGVLPGLREGLSWIRKDESRHITYGTYLARRILAARPDLIGVARDRMFELRDFYFSEELVLVPPEQLDEADVAGRMLINFRDYALMQVERRIKVLEAAAGLSTAAAEAGEGTEEAEAELAEISV